MDFTLVGLWNEMGFIARAVVVLVLVAMSLYSLAITGDRLRTFWRGRKQSRLYIEALAPMVEAAGPAARGGRPGQALRGQPGRQRHRRGPDRVRARRRPTGRGRRAVRGRRGRQPRDGAEQGARAGRAAPRDAGAGDGRVVGAVRRPVRHRRRHHHRLPEAGRPDQGRRRHRHRLGRHRGGADHDRRRSGRRDRRGLVLQLLHRAARRHDHRHRRDGVRAGRHDPAGRRDATDRGHRRAAAAPRRRAGGQAPRPRGRCGPRSTSRRWSTSCWCC